MRTSIEISLNLLYCSLFYEEELIFIQHRLISIFGKRSRFRLNMYVHSDSDVL